MLSKQVLFPLATIAASLFAVILALPGGGSELFARWDENKTQAIGDKYANSQYVLGESGEKIDDATLYLYAGMAYVRGEDPTTINFEHPPLGKYLFGLSWLLFNNPLTLNIAVFLAILLVFWQLLLQLKASLWWQLGGIALLSYTIGGYLSAPLLDLPMLFLTLTFMLVLFKKSETGWKYALVGLSLGALAATKYPIPTIAIYLLPLGYWLWQKKAWRFVPLIVLVAGGVYLLSYWSYFANGHSLMDLLNFEKYRLSWWTGDRPLRWWLIWQMLFIGTFETWWGEGWLSDSAWNSSMPVLFLGSLYAAWQLCKKGWKKLSSPAVVLLLFSFGMMGAYTIGSGYLARYLFIVYPFWYSICMLAFQKKHELSKSAQR